MFKTAVIHVVVLSALVFQVLKGDPQGIEGSNRDEEAAINFLRMYETEASAFCNLIMEANWNYHTNMTDVNSKNMLLRQFQGTQYRRKKWQEASKFRWRSFRNSKVRRIFSFITVLGSSALDGKERKEYAELLEEMKTTFSRTRICPYNERQKKFTQQPRSTFKRERTRKDGPDFVVDDVELVSQDDYDVNSDNDDVNCIPTMQLEPDIVRIMAESRDPKELRYVWREWRKKAGRPLREKFTRFIQLSNKAARLNGFNDTAEFWKRDYEGDTFEYDLEDLWKEVKPLYEQLHTYVRKKLIKRYGEELFSSDGTIPAHLLGNMWGQSWTNILDFTIPFPGRTFTDVTKSMRQQGYNPIRIFRTAEDFFLSLGFEPLPRSFWLRSMFEKPRNREVICHTSAWDFCNGRDYRIKQCTQITMNDLVTAHHEMGHIQYGMNYRTLPLAFRDGANPGFHEAIGDALALSASTPNHLKKIGLESNQRQDTFEDDINFLFSMALDKVAFLPFGYLVDKWRWKVFSGDVETKYMNNFWWELRVRYQGISPPVLRTENDFDPGAKYHIPANIPYIRYFVGFILQFQIHEELCRASGHNGSLHKCDIYGSEEAGIRLRNMMQLGKSQPWPLALSQLTEGRTDRLDAKPLLRYFSNLNEWLIKENRNDQVGWSTSEALTALTGALIDTSSATFIALLIVAILFMILVLWLAIHFFRKAMSKKKRTPTT